MKFYIHWGYNRNFGIEIIFILEVSDNSVTKVSFFYQITPVPLQFVSNSTEGVKNIIQKHV